MEQTENFLPEKLQSTITIPDNWHPEKSVKKINKLTSICKPAIEDIIVEFWIAHEKLVKKEIEGWTWGRFCKETGYHNSTPYRWFEKYNMPITKITHKTELENTSSSNPLRTHTKPDDKIKLNEIKEKIKENSFSDDDLKAVSDTIAEKVASGQSGIRIGSKMATAVKKKEINKKQKKEFESNFTEKSRIQILNSKLEHALEELKFLVQGDIEKQGGDEIWIKAIATKGPSFIWQFHKLGIDLNKVYQTLINPGKELNYDSKRKEGKERQLGEEIIDIDP